MDKTKKLTKREKLLITLAAVIGAIYVIVFLLFIPAIEQLSESSQKYDDAVFRQQEMQLAIAGEPLAQKQNEKAQATLEENQKFFSAYMTDYELDQYITDLCNSCGLSPSLLAIQEVVEVGAPEGQDEAVAGDITQENAQETMAEAKGQTTEQPEPTPTPTPAAAPVMKATIMVEGPGNMSNLEQLMAKVSDTGFLLAKSVKYADDSQTINVVFELYMNKPTQSPA